MLKPDLESGSELERWVESRRRESSLAGEIAKLRVKKTQDQSKARVDTDKDLRDTGACPQSSDFRFLDQYLSSPKDALTPGDVEKFGTTIESLSGEFGEGYVETMYRVWERAPKTPETTT